jgi:thymidylate synthase (FAD)
MHNFVADGFVVHNSFSEASARYSPLPTVDYVPTVERLMLGGGHLTKQAGAIAGARELTRDAAEAFRQMLQESYSESENCYQSALAAGVPKELARVMLPVGRYSTMRATANLRNWLHFLNLRLAENAQWEIRQYAQAVSDILTEAFPRTMELFAESRAK